MADVVERADMRMVQARNGLRFALETFAQLRIVGKMSGKNLDCDDAVEAGIARAVHLAHTARTERSDDFVGPQASPSRESHKMLADSIPLGDRCAADWD